MKVIITGATGFVGQELLRQCIARDSITSIVVLTRRQLDPTPTTTNPKVKVVLVDNFLNYSPAVRSETQGAQACLWSIGLTPSQARNRDDVKTISVDYTMAAARAFTEQIVVKDGGKSKFRFVYVSASATERDQNKSLWFLGPFRKIRGQVENELIEHAKQNPNTFELYIVRPGIILKKDFNLTDLVKSVWVSVKVDALAKFMIDVTQKGFARDIIENGTVVEQAEKFTGA